MTVLRIIVPILVFAICAIAWMPMRSALVFLDASATGIHIGHATGSVWNASLSDVSVRSAPLGDFETRARPDRAGFAFRSNGPRSNGPRSNGPVSSGEARWTASGWRLEALAGQIDLATLSPESPPGLVAIFEGVSLDASSAGCRSTAGRVKLEGSALGSLSGSQGVLGCVDGRTTLDLRDEASGATLKAWLANDADGRTRLQAQTEDPVLLAALLSAGIQIAAPDVR